MHILPGLVNFIAMIAVLYFAARKAMASFLVTRRQTIATTVVEAEKLSNDAEKQLSHWETQFRSCEAHGKGLLEEAKQAVTRFRQSSEERVKSELARIKKETELVGQSESARAKNILQKEVVEQSVQAAGQYLRGHLTEDDRHGIVKEYLEIVANGEK